MIGLAGQYIFFGGKIRVEFVLNCVFGALAAITGKESFKIVQCEPLIRSSLTLLKGCVNVFNDRHPQYSVDLKYRIVASSNVRY